MTNNDREWNLQRLAEENGYWAEEELHLIELIRQYKKRLRELPDIIRRLNEERERVIAEMNRTGIEHDSLEAQIKKDKEFSDFAINSRARVLSAKVPFYGEQERVAFRAWANDQADDYADFLLTTQPPRPNPFGLFRR